MPKLLEKLGQLFYGPGKGQNRNLLVTALTSYLVLTIVKLTNRDVRTVSQSLSLSYLKPSEALDPLYFRDKLSRHQINSPH
jgi:hypothetical protein